MGLLENQEGHEAIYVCKAVHNGLQKSILHIKEEGKGEAFY